MILSLRRRKKKSTDCCAEQTKGEEEKNDISYFIISMDRVRAKNSMWPNGESAFCLNNNKNGLLYPESIDMVWQDNKANKRSVSNKR